MRKCGQILSITLIGILLFFGVGLAQSSLGQARQVVVVLWHGMELDQVMDLKFNKPVAWGLLNTRSGGGDAQTGAYLSLGAGARAVGSKQAAVFSQDVADQMLFRLRTGLPPGPIVQPQIAQILAAQQVNYTVVPGALGDACTQEGAPILALGNSDGEQTNRWAALVGMDGLGRVWKGNIGRGILLDDDNYPYGVRTDYEQLKTEILGAEEPLVIVDLGDPHRYDLYQELLLPSQRSIMQRQMVAEIKVFLHDLVLLQPDDCVLMLLGPFPTQTKAENNYWLTPVLISGVSDGVLISSTTRWPGLITNMDIAPTLLEMLSIVHNQPFIGRPASFRAQDAPLEYVQKMESKIVLLSKYRSSVLQMVVVSQIVLYSVVLAALIRSEPISLRLRDILQKSLVLFSLLPMFLLLWSHVFWATGLLIAALFVRRLQRGYLFEVATITCATAVILGFDLCLGNWLIRYSYLGYDPVGGARFYGLGNEFMGILLGASIVTWSIACQKIQWRPYFRELIGFFVFGVVLIFIGAPSLGTNVGGAISAVFAFGFTWLAFKEQRLTWKHVLALVFVLVVALGLLIVSDIVKPSAEQSHIGQTVQLFKRDGPRALWQIIVRKVAVNLKLLRYSIWSKALLAAVLVMAASLIWPSEFISWLKRTYPFIAKGIGGIVVGSIAALIFNDSGVVAAATCLYFASTTLLLLALELKHNFHSP